jgi:hypothetical protein
MPVIIALLQANVQPVTALVGEYAKVDPSLLLVGVIVGRLTNNFFTQLI